MLRVNIYSLYLIFAVQIMNSLFKSNYVLMWSYDGHDCEYLGETLKWCNLGNITSRYPGDSVRAVRTQCLSLFLAVSKARFCITFNASDTSKFHRKTRCAEACFREALRQSNRFTFIQVAYSRHF